MHANSTEGACIFCGAPADFSQGMVDKLISLVTNSSGDGVVTVLQIGPERRRYPAYPAGVYVVLTVDVNGNKRFVRLPDPRATAGDASTGRPPLPTGSSADTE